MEGQDSSLVHSTQWRDLLHLTSRFLSDASGLMDAHLARQRILGSSKSEKKQKAKTKRAKSGYEYFGEMQRKELNGEVQTGIPLGEQSKLISAKWQGLSNEEKEKWREMALGIKEEDATGHSDTHTTPVPTKPKPSLSEAFERASDSSRGKHCTCHTARESQSSSEHGDSSSEEEPKPAKKSKHKHKHASSSKKRS